jgi:exonuclease III
MEVEDVLYMYDIFGVSETMRRDDDVAMEVEGYAWAQRCRAGKEVRRASGGVGLFIKQSLMDSGVAMVMADSADSRIWMKVNGGDGMRDTYVCQVYGPVKGAQSFWEQLTAEVVKYKMKGDVIVMGDMNARMGDATGDGDSNENGDELKEMCDVCGMFVVNGSEYASGKWTWSSGDSRSVIDYVLVNKDAVSRVSSMVVREDEDSGSDHNVLELVWKVMDRETSEM